MKNLFSYKHDFYSAVGLFQMSFLKKIPEENYLFGRSTEPQLYLQVWVMYNLQGLQGRK